VNERVLVTDLTDLGKPKCSQWTRDFFIHKSGEESLLLGSGVLL